MPAKIRKLSPPIGPLTSCCSDECNNLNVDFLLDHYLLDCTNLCHLLTTETFWLPQSVPNMYVGLHNVSFSDETTNKWADKW